MSFLEEAAQKRLDARQKQESATAFGKLAKTTDIDSLIEQVKEVQLASLLGASKPSVILTDQTDLGDKMAELGDKLNETVKQLDSRKVNEQQLTALKSLQSTLDTYRNGISADIQTSHEAFAKVLTALSAIDRAPVFNVPEPKVMIQEREVDLSPLQDTIKEYFKTPEVDKIDLDNYRAQDIANSENMQYVGFVNPDGGWYIIENDTKGNSLRYVFGLGGYKKAFKAAAGYKYLLLNEAIDALTA